VAVNRFSPDCNAIRYVLPVLWMTSYFHIMETVGQNQMRRVRFVDAPGGGPVGESAISYCIFVMRTFNVRVLTSKA